MPRDKYYVIHPNGDETKLSFVSQTAYNVWDVSYKHVATNQSFWRECDAIKFAKQMAKTNNLEYLESPFI